MLTQPQTTHTHTHSLAGLFAINNPNPLFCPHHHCYHCHHTHGAHFPCYESNFILTSHPADHILLRPQCRSPDQHCACSCLLDMQYGKTHAALFGKITAARKQEEQYVKLSVLHRNHDVMRMIINDMGLLLRYVSICSNSSMRKCICCVHVIFAVITEHRACPHHDEGDGAVVYLDAAGDLGVVQ